MVLGGGGKNSTYVVNASVVMPWEADWAEQVVVVVGRVITVVYQPRRFPRQQCEAETCSPRGRGKARDRNPNAHSW